MEAGKFRIDTKSEYLIRRHILDISQSGPTIQSEESRKLQNISGCYSPHFRVVSVRAEGIFDASYKIVMTQ